LLDPGFLEKFCPSKARFSLQVCGDITERWRNPKWIVVANRTWLLDLFLDGSKCSGDILC